MVVLVMGGRSGGSVGRFLRAFGSLVETGQGDAAGAAKAGDRIMLSQLEHHSNIVPWQMLRERKGAVLKWLDTAPPTDRIGCWQRRNNCCVLLTSG